LTPSTPTAEAGEDARLDAALRAAVSGDRDGFVALYRTLQPRLYRYARALVGQDADDVTAEAWLQITRDLATFRGDADGFRGWTASITRHRALDLLKSRSRRPADAVGLHVRSDPTNDLPTANATADAALEALSTARALSLIASLPRHQAEAVLLRAVVGLSADTAGTVLGKRAGAVRIAAHRGLQTLARRLGGGT
jgi:RNA polymerase sigma-70 factor (ECF subfamily)